MDGDEPICGETYDHALRLIDERDGYVTYECTECGAEVYTEMDDEGRLMNTEYAQFADTPGCGWPTGTAGTGPCVCGKPAKVHRRQQHSHHRHAHPRREGMRHPRTQSPTIPLHRRTDRGGNPMTADAKPRGICPICGRTIHLVNAGTVGSHGAKDGTWPPRRCDGVGYPPAGQEATQ